MSRRPRRPSEPHIRHNAQSHQRSDDRAESSTDDWGRPSRAPIFAAALLAAGCVLYGYVFFSQPQHFPWLALALVPDVVIGNWFGGGERWQFAWLDRTGVILGAALLLGLAAGWGRLLVECLFGPHGSGTATREMWDTWERQILGLALGLPLVSLVTLAAGCCGWLRQPALVAGLLLAVTALGAAWRWRIRSTRQEPMLAGTSSASELNHDAHESRDSSFIPTWSPFDWALLVLVSAMSFLILCGGLLPPWEFDVREYHLQAPKEWWQTGRIEFLPHNIYANMPLGAEMFALLAMVFCPGDEPWWWGGLMGKAVIAAFAPLTAGLLFAAGRRCGSQRAGLVAAAVFITTPWTAHVAMAGLIDGVLAFYVLATVFVLVVRFGERLRSSPFANPSSESITWRVSAAAGWLAGAAAACKYPGLVLVVAPVGCGMLVSAWRGSIGWKSVAAFSLAAALMGGPWYAKNWITTGNPTYPLLAGVFGGQTRSAEKDAQWRAAHRERDSEGRSYTSTLLARAVARVGWRSDWLSPIVWPLACAALFTAWRRSGLWLVGGIAAWIFLAWWLAAHRIDRFWLPALPLLAWIAGCGAVARSDVAWQSVTSVMLACGLMLGALASVAPGQPGNALGDVRFFVPLAQIREANQHPLHRELERVVPAGSAALLIGDAQPFDLRCRVVYATCFDDSPLGPLVERLTAEQRRAAFQAVGISHVGIDWNEIARYRQPGNYGFPSFVTRELFAELTAEPAVLRRLPGDPRWGELFEVLAPGPSAD